MGLAHVPWVLSFSHAAVQCVSQFTSSQMGQRYLMEVARKKKYSQAYAEEKRKLKESKAVIVSKDLNIKQLREDIDRLESEKGNDFEVQMLKARLNDAKAAKQKAEESWREALLEEKNRKGKEAEEAAKAAQQYLAQRIAELQKAHESERQKEKDIVSDQERRRQKELRAVFEKTLASKEQAIQKLKENISKLETCAEKQCTIEKLKKQLNDANDAMKSAEDARREALLE